MLALKAIIAYDLRRQRATKAGEIAFFVDGVQAGPWQKFDSSSTSALTFASPESLTGLGPLGLEGYLANSRHGLHTLALQMREGSQLPVSISLAMHSFTPEPSANCAVRLSLALGSSINAGVHSLMEGQSSQISLNLTNLRDTGVGMTVTIVGLPAGLEPRHDQLRELKDSGKIAYYEVSGRDVVMYWRGLAAHAAFSLVLDVVAIYPGSYVGAASRAYLYYVRLLLLLFNRSI